MALRSVRGYVKEGNENKPPKQICDSFKALCRALTFYYISFYLASTDLYNINLKVIPPPTLEISQYIRNACLENRY